MTTIGVAVGIAGAAGVTRLMEAVLLGIDPLDPIAFAATSLLLAGTGVLAT